jgi:hypothetical protein
MCWFPYPHFYISGNTPCSTGNSTHTGYVRCPYRYCTPLHFTSFLANALRYVPIQSLSKFSYFYRYCNDASTGMVIHNITVPVLSLQCKKSFPVWKYRKLQYRYCHREVRRQYRYGNSEYHNTGTVIMMF